MSAVKPGRLIFLSGPSCIGKGSLVKALKKFHRKQYNSLRRVVLYNSRAPRPGETDGVEFFFRPRPFIENLVKERGLLAIESRGDLHALDVDALQRVLRRHDALLMDNPYMIHALRAHPKMPQVTTVTVMMTPISRKEIRYYRRRKDMVFSFEDFVTDLMRRKLLRRTQRQKQILGLRDLEDIETRARNAYLELKEAHHFDHVLVNHTGGDNEFWNSFYYPVGDALRCLRSFRDIIRGRKPRRTEKWEPGLVP